MDRSIYERNKHLDSTARSTRTKTHLKQSKQARLQLRTVPTDHVQVKSALTLILRRCGGHRGSGIRNSTRPRGKKRRRPKKKHAWINSSQESINQERMEKVAGNRARAAPRDGLPEARDAAWGVVSSWASSAELSPTSRAPLLSSLEGERASVCQFAEFGGVFL